MHRKGVFLRSGKATDATCCHLKEILGRASGKVARASITACVVRSPDPLHRPCVLTAEVASTCAAAVAQTRLWPSALPIVRVHQRHRRRTWEQESDLNSRPRGYEPRELPNCSILLQCLLARSGENDAVSPAVTARRLDPSRLGQGGHDSTSRTTAIAVEIELAPVFPGCHRFVLLSTTGPHASSAQRSQGPPMGRLTETHASLPARAKLGARTSAVASARDARRRNIAGLARKVRRPATPAPSTSWPPQTPSRAERRRQNDAVIPSGFPLRSKPIRRRAPRRGYCSARAGDVFSLELHDDASSLRTESRSALVHVHVRR